MTGTEWDVERVVRVVDGDTVRLIRQRRLELDGGQYLLSDALSDGVPIRLVWVDTPERGQPGYHEARADLVKWAQLLGRHPLTVVCYESAGWDRLLGDLIDADGHSASQWLMRERGWPPYQPK
jgi:endonuclease YncB( thermonuclease family)